jgi:hypothetical protein
MSAKFQLKRADGTFMPQKAPVVTWLSRNAASLRHKCGTEMSFAPLQQRTPYQHRIR